jgi:hypothetical protein
MWRKTMPPGPKPKFLPNGTRVGNLTVASRIESNTPEIKYNCICDCETVVVRTGRWLKMAIKGKVTSVLSCGCGPTDRGDRYTKDIKVGDKIGFLTILEEYKLQYLDIGLHTYYKCICGCGNIVEKLRPRLLDAIHRFPNRVFSCGCKDVRNDDARHNERSKFAKIDSNEELAELGLSVGDKICKCTILRVSKDISSSHSTRIIHFKCECGNKVKRSKVKVKKHLDRYKLTLSCGCYKDPFSFENNNNYKHIFGKLPRGYWTVIKKNASVRNFEFNITPEYAWNLWEIQNGKCCISGMELSLKHSKFLKVYRTASLDRIDSSKGYIEGNVQWVHKDVNRMKWTHKEGYFIQLCKTIGDYQNSKQVLPSQQSTENEQLHGANCPLPILD